VLSDNVVHITKKVIVPSKYEKFNILR